MATMIPTSLTGRPEATAEVRQLFDLFEAALPDSCQVRYEVQIAQRQQRPDFVLVDHRRGVWMIDVVDWQARAIGRSTPEQVWVRHGRRAAEPTKNPDLKCRTYLAETRDRLAEIPELCDSPGSVRVPLHYAVALPNISRRDFGRLQLGTVMEPDCVLLRDDLKQEAFAERWEAKFPLSDEALAPGAMALLVGVLFPDTVIDLGAAEGFIPRDTEDAADRRLVHSIQLSVAQEQIAKGPNVGPTLLRGIAGTGKSLVMLTMAKLLAANYTDTRVLVLCWNPSLTDYLRQVFDQIRLPSYGQVKIQCFAEFAWALCDVDVDDPRLDDRLTGLYVPDSDKYDAIFVDEGQDFRPEWLSVMYSRLLRGEPAARSLVVVADDAQRVLPGRDFPWATLDIPFKDRSTILKSVYRNSARIWMFAAFLLEDRASYLLEDPSRVSFSSKAGYDPCMIACASLEAQVEKAVHLIAQVIRGGYAPRNVLVLYRHRQVSGFPLVDHLRDRLDEEGIPFVWTAEDTEARQDFGWDEDTVKVATVQAAKGMDSPVVIVLGAETFDPQLAPGECDETGLMYVALTRAREFLAVLYTGYSGMVPELLCCRDEYFRFRNAIIELEREAA